MIERSAESLLTSNQILAVLDSALSIKEFEHTRMN